MISKSFDDTVNFNSRVLGTLCQFPDFISHHGETAFSGNLRAA
jgi:hypothetical protein